MGNATMSIAARAPHRPSPSCLALLEDLAGELLVLRLLGNQSL